MHNTVSLDVSVKDFEVDIGLHYEVADRFKADAHLIGSETARTGIELYTEQIPQEQPSDFNKPQTKPGDTRPLWVIQDTKGKLKGLLHVYRRACYCRGVVVLVIGKTPDDYFQYLRARNYDVITAGDDHVDYRSALERLNSLYGVRTVLVDSGGGLGGILLNEGFVNEVSLLISPSIVGKHSTSLFRGLENNVNLDLIRIERVRGNHLLVLYRVLTNIATLTPLHIDSESQRDSASNHP
jgi:2,5-diamino-6-(ribosylamino)-4(3H)-pyrimidinone 5'-phosphate reductase